MLNRRSLLKALSATVAAPIVLRPLKLLAAMPVYDPADFGPVTGNATAAWQGAINAARSYNGGRGGIVRPDALAYQVGSLDCTGMQNVVIDAPPGCWLYGNQQTLPAPILDFTGSSNCQVRNLVTAAQNLDGNPPSVKPLAGVLFGETIAHGDSNKNRMDNVGTIGAFRTAGLAIIGSTDNAFYSCALQQDDGAAPALCISVLPDWYILSRFKTLTTAASNVGDQSFFACEFHGFRGVPTGDYWTTYMRGADNVRFEGGNHDCSGKAHFLFQGSNKKITSAAQKFYSESGHPPKYIFQSDAPGVSDLVCINPNESDNAYSTARTFGTFANSPRFL